MSPHVGLTLARLADLERRVSALERDALDRHARIVAALDELGLPFHVDPEDGDDAGHPVATR